jgi:hypothetical protein
VLLLERGEERRNSSGKIVAEIIKIKRKTLLLFDSDVRILASLLEITDAAAAAKDGTAASRKQFH